MASTSRRALWLWPLANIARGPQSRRFRGRHHRRDRSARPSRSQAILGKTAGREARSDAWDLAEELGAWDPLVASIRASRELADTFAANEALRPALAALYQRTNDLGLARLGGFELARSGIPADLLSPRELEVLGLIARGYRNQEIANALVLSLSTVKVHVRHIFEKLGVRTRSEAVTRLTTIA